MTRESRKILEQARQARRDDEPSRLREAARSKLRQVIGELDREVKAFKEGSRCRREA